MKTDLNDLVTCKCGIVLEMSRIIKKVEKNENTPEEFIYLCPVCIEEVEE